MKINAYLPLVVYLLMVICSLFAFNYFEIKDTPVYYTTIIVASLFALIAIAMYWTKRSHEDVEITKQKEADTRSVNYETDKARYNAQEQEAKLRQLEQIERTKEKDVTRFVDTNALLEKQIQLQKELQEQIAKSKAGSAQIGN